MVAKIKSGKSLAGALNYNEAKLRDGKANIIAAEGYPKEPEQLSFDEKLFRLTDRAAANARVKTNTVHISLNFAVGERLEIFALQQIAAEYMGQLGFGGQPYLVYRHHDAGHPHIHVRP